MHIIAPPSSAPFSIVITEHQPHLIRRFVPPAKVVWVTLQPCSQFRVEFAYGRQFAIAPVVTIHF
ncbi:hypothetical protein [uncultured Sphingomonas sp.]|uniref:hypothetical protein n=1 Tax=uncultured Sphingomonas sp. TaxID=158754 RepID=UPI00260DFCB4|nr:hypothetical protein [uncultured Sphingomonas sp.]